jgi:purine-binding chemotaxis protein CheW
MAENLPHVIFTLQNGKYAISGEYVLHIEVLGKVTPMVDSQPYCRGVVLFNGQSIPVFDMRGMFGIGNYAEELHNFMMQRIQDHEEWVAALEDHVASGVPFDKTTDPHQCAFGKWYDNFETDNSYLGMYLKSVDKPHKDIHETGEMVLRLMKEGKTGEAREAIQEMKATSFAKTKEILSGAAAVYEEGAREMLIIISTGGETRGIIVDSINSIKRLEDMCGVPPVRNSGDRYIEDIAVDKDSNDDLILILDAKLLGA